jgi:hypothetical protein
MGVIRDTDDLERSNAENPADDPKPHKNLAQRLHDEKVAPSIAIARLRAEQRS